MTGLCPIACRRDLYQLSESFSVDTNELLRTEFAFVDDDDTAWFGQVPRLSKREVTLEMMRAALKRIPDEMVYPVPPRSVLLVDLPVDTTRIYIKRPKLICCGDEGETQLLPEILLGEVKVLEYFKNHPHPNIVPYYGCTVKRGRVTSICLERYPQILQYFHQDGIDLDIDNLMEAVRAGVNHLHDHGFAHNDINPANIALDKSNTPVIIDFGSCRRFGEELLTAGTPGWIDEDYSTSAKQHDLDALARVDHWARKEHAEQRTEKQS